MPVKELNMYFLEKKALDCYELPTTYKQVNRKFVTFLPKFWHNPKSFLSLHI